MKVETAIEMTMADLGDGEHAGDLPPPSGGGYHAMVVVTLHQNRSTRSVVFKM